MYISQTEHAILKLEVGRVINDSKLIAGIIQRDKLSKEKRQMREGVNYYEGEQAILTKDFQSYYVEGQKKTNKAKANNKIANAFFPDIVDQKIDYVLATSPTITSKNKTFADEINEVFRERFDKILRDVAEGTSLKGIEWAHTFINAEGQFDYVITPAEGIIPDYDEVTGRLKSILRYYLVDFLNEKSELKQRTKVEIWTDTQVYFYIEEKENQFILDNTEPINPRPHWNNLKKLGDVVVESEGANWGKVPFIPLHNNKRKINDLRRIKSLIDVYDLILSAFANQVEDSGEVVVKVRDYDGTDNHELAQMLKETKIIKVSGTGDAEALELKIPVEAKEKVLSILEKNIYRFGRAVNFNDENFAGDQSGIALQFKFAGLDLKANQMIRGLIDFIKEFLSFYAIYLEKENEYKTTDLEITFSKSIIINETEIISNVQSSNGIVSKKTLLQKHPWVKDVDAELKQIELEDNQDDINLEDGDDTV